MARRRAVALHLSATSAPELGLVAHCVSRVKRPITLIIPDAQILFKKNFCSVDKVVIFVLARSTRSTVCVAKGHIPLQCYNPKTTHYFKVKYVRLTYIFIFCAFIELTVGDK